MPPLRSAYIHWLVAFTAFAAVITLCIDRYQLAAAYASRERIMRSIDAISILLNEFHSKNGRYPDLNSIDALCQQLPDSPICSQLKAQLKSNPCAQHLIVNSNATAYRLELQSFRTTIHTIPGYDVNSSSRLTSPSTTPPSAARTQPLRGWSGYVGR